MSTSRNRIQRVAGSLVIIAIWLGLIGLLGFFSVVYAIYADLRSPERSHLTVGTGAEFIAGALYGQFRSPWKTLPDSELIYVPSPGAVTVRSPEYDTIMTIAPDGSRFQPASRDKGNLVVIAGDSFALGLGVGDDQTYSALLQARFHRNTVNTGVISYGTARELWRLRRLGLLARASVIVIQFCSNDGRENSDFLASPDGHFGRDGARPEPWIFVENSYYPDLSYFRVLASTVQWLRRRVHDEGIRRAVKSVVRSRRAALGAPVSARDNLSGRELAVDFLAVLDLFPELKEKPVFVLELNDRGSSTGFLTALANLAATRANLRTIDVMYQAEDFFRFDGHLRPQGHERVAVAVENVLREGMKKSTTP